MVFFRLETEWGRGFFPPKDGMFTDSRSLPPLNPRRKCRLTMEGRSTGLRFILPACAFPWISPQWRFFGGRQRSQLRGQLRYFRIPF